MTKQEAFLIKSFYELLLDHIKNDRIDLLESDIAGAINALEKDEHNEQP